MTSPKPLEFAFGGATFGTDKPYNTPEVAEAIYKALKDHGINTIDTAQIYGDSEAFLGETKACSHGFIIDSKTPGGMAPGQALLPDNLYKQAHESAKKLGVLEDGGLDIFYIHAPDSDPSTKVADYLPVFQKLHDEKIFKRLGLSNFSAEQVQEVYDYAEKHNLIKPTVYQGNYNAVARHSETTLFPTLRKLGMSFYAYSPIAGGFLTKKPDQFSQAIGRFRDTDFIGQMYTKLYSSKQSMLEGLATWNSIADKEGISTGELAYRWITYSSILKPEFGDKLITGARNVDQVSQMMGWVAKGPLSEEAQKGIDGVWDTVKGDAYEHNMEALKEMQIKP